MASLSSFLPVNYDDGNSVLSAYEHSDQIIEEHRFALRTIINTTARTCLLVKNIDLEQI